MFAFVFSLFRSANVLGEEEEELEQPETVLASRSESTLRRSTMYCLLIKFTVSAVGKHIVPSMTGSRKVNWMALATAIRRCLSCKQGRSFALLRYLSTVPSPTPVNSI
jgi:hypothetical protein